MFLKGIYFNLKELNKLYVKLFLIIKNYKDVSYKLNIPGKNKIFLVFYAFFLKQTFKKCKPITL